MLKPGGRTSSKRNSSPLVCWVVLRKVIRSPVTGFSMMSPAFATGTNVETAATNKRTDMMAVGLSALGRPSIPSGLRIDPRLPITPGENATQSAPTIVTNTVSHANHLQRLLGNRPLGNSRSERTIQPIYGIHTQEENQASASPAGSELGRATRA